MKGCLMILIKSKIPDETYNASFRVTGHVIEYEVFEVQTLADDLIQFAACLAFRLEQLANKATLLEAELSEIEAKGNRC